MARSRASDYLQNHRFWLIDLQPGPVLPFFVLGSPKFAFQSISAPELTAQVHPIAQLNSTWQESEYLGAEAGVITLRRGVRFGDGSFYRWFRKALVGRDISRHNLLLIHYSSLSRVQVRDNPLFAGGRVGPGGDVPSFGSILPLHQNGDAALIAGRAWILWGCKPIRYRAAPDFDATSGDVSIMELDVQPTAIEEFALPT